MNEIRAKEGIRPMVSIIVLNYNSGPLLLECVESVRRCSKDYELIVVDNASRDRSLERVRADILIRNSRNLGFARGNNVGLKHAKGRFIVLLNSDTRVTEGWLESLLAEFQDPRVGLVQPKLVRFDGLLDSTGHRWDDRWQGPRVHDRGDGEPDRGQFDMSRELKSCCFACVMIRRQVIDRLGPLDENYLLFYEDVDYSLMAWNDGWRVRYCPEAKVYHQRGASYRASGTQRRKLQSQTSPYMTRIVLKNYPLREALGYALREPFIVMIMIVVGLRNRDLAYVSKSARVLYWNLLRLPVRERLRLANLKILDSAAEECYSSVEPHRSNTSKKASIEDSKSASSTASVAHPRPAVTRMRTHDLGPKRTPIPRGLAGKIRGRWAASSRGSSFLRFSGHALDWFGEDLLVYYE